MGKFSPNRNNIYQEIDGVLGGGMYAMPAYFHGNVYFGPQGHNLLHFRFSKAKLSTAPVSKSAITFTYPGSTPSVSAHGSSNGIVWAIEHASPSCCTPTTPATSQTNSTTRTRRRTDAISSGRQPLRHTHNR